MSFGRVETVGQQGGAGEQPNGCQTAGSHVVLLSRVGADKPAIEIVDQVGRTPVQVRKDGRGVGRNQTGDHEADPADRQIDQHGRIGDVVTNQGRIEIRECLSNIGKLGIDDDRAQGNQDPRPGTEAEVGDVEEQHAAQRVLFRFRCKHALSDVAAAARFGAGIPDSPPIHRDRHDEDGHRNVPVVLEIGHDVEVAHPGRALQVLKLLDHPVQTAHLRQFQREVGGRDHGRHLDEELDHIDDQHAPETGMGGKNHVEHAASQQRLPSIQPEQNAGDLAGSQIHVGHDDDVEEEAEVNGPETADHARGLAGVAHLVKFQVGHDARSSPKPGVEEDGQNAREHERPPLPIAGDAVDSDEVRHEVGRIAGEGRRDHREPGQPPRDAAARCEEFRRPF